MQQTTTESNHYIDNLASHLKPQHIFRRIDIDYSKIQLTMECDTSSRKAKICYLACGCRRICSCKDTEFDNNKDDDDGRSKQYSSGTSTSTSTWMSSWFDNAHRQEDHSTICSHEMRTAYNAKQMEKQMDMYHGKRVYPTQARRTHLTFPIPNDVPNLPSYTVIGHPSLHIYKFRLPDRLLHLLDQIVVGCATYADSLTTGWM